MSIISHLYNQKWFICDKIDFYLFLVNNIINLWIIRTDIKYIGFNFVLTFSIFLSSITFFHFMFVIIKSYIIFSFYPQFLHSLWTCSLCFLPSFGLFLCIAMSALVVFVIFWSLCLVLVNFLSAHIVFAMLWPFQPQRIKSYSQHYIIQWSSTLYIYWLVQHSFE